MLATMLTVALAAAVAERDLDPDEARVRDHLVHVHAALVVAPCPSDDASACAARRAALDELARYTEARRYPHNTRVARAAGAASISPVFIDEHDHVCAVGHLLVWSGHERDARAIAATHNHARVHALAALPDVGPSLAAWAREHGFTVDELARIQPTYGRKVRCTAWDPRVVVRDAAGTWLVREPEVAREVELVTGAGLADGRVVLFGRGAVFEFDGASWRAFGGPDDISSVARVGDALWVGTARGVRRYDGEGDTSELALARTERTPWLLASEAVFLLEGGRASEVTADGVVTPLDLPAALHVVAARRHAGTLYVSGNARVLRRNNDGTWSLIGFDLSPMAAAGRALVATNGAGLEVVEPDGARRVVAAEDLAVSVYGPDVAWPRPKEATLLAAVTTPRGATLVGAHGLVVDVDAATGAVTRSRAPTRATLRRAFMAGDELWALALDRGCTDGEDDGESGMGSFGDDVTPRPAGTALVVRDAEAPHDVAAAPASARRWATLQGPLEAPVGASNAEQRAIHGLPPLPRMIEGRAFDGAPRSVLVGAAAAFAIACVVVATLVRRRHTR